MKNIATFFVSCVAYFLVSSHLFSKNGVSDEIFWKKYGASGCGSAALVVQQFCCH